MSISITKYCHIKNKRISVNGNIVFENNEAANFSEFIRSSYKFAGMAYPKFYKMDNPCKLAIVATELLLKETSVIEKCGKDKVGVVLQNSSSTIDTDNDFQLTIDDRANYFPSPAVFVYTLPNILIGEICIRHGIKGENAFLVSDHFDPGKVIESVKLLLNKDYAQACLCGWVEVLGDQFESVLFLVEKEKTIKEYYPGGEYFAFNIESLTHFYQNK